MSSQTIQSVPWPKVPLPNSYWVVPGRLLAGECPGTATLAATTERLHALLAAGVTLFVDLTEEGEVSEYSHLLMYAAGAEEIHHVRYSIDDHKIPDSPHVMLNILDTIDAHLAKNKIAYVHCRAGIGRTGTVMGCFLQRQGLDGDASLDRLNELWCESERSRSWPHIPETEEQIEYVKKWHTLDPKLVAQRANGAGKMDRYIGAMIGMAVGEALGAMVTVDMQATATLPTPNSLIRELSSGGPHNVPRGAWLADTAMCCCLAESLLACRGSMAQDQMERYLSWQRDGKFSNTGAALNVPAEVRKALAQWQWTHKPIAGSHDPNNRDAHALARTLAVVLYFADSPARALLEAAEAARTTLQAPLALDANRVFATVLLDAINGTEKDSLLTMKQSDAAHELRRNKLKPQLTQTIDGWWRGPAPPARTGSDVLSVLNTALWAFHLSEDFREGVALASNLSGNPTSSGAVFGALAGAYYGVQGIPQEWRRAILHSDALINLAERLAQR